MCRFICLAAALLVVACSPGGDSPGANAQQFELPASPIKRCINLGGALEAPNEGDWGYTVRQKDLVRIREAGFDTVRLPVKWSAHADVNAPYTIDPSIIERVLEIIQQADTAGLQTVVDLHHYNELMARPKAHYERLYALWEQISEALAGAPDSVILELLNEPNDRMTVGRTDRVNARLLEIVRQSHPDRWVVVGGANWGNLGALLDSNPPDDDRVILTFHTYAPYDFTHQGAYFADPPPPTGQTWGTQAEIDAARSAAQRAARFGAEHDSPVLLGEFGVFEDVPLAQRVKWTRAVREAAEENKIGWCYWDFATTFKAYIPEREAWIGSLLSALIED
jgi:endoglucanase